MNRIVVTGAAGQVGSEMVAALRDRYGDDAVLATDIREPDDALAAGPFRLLDVTMLVALVGLAWLIPAAAAGGGGLDLAGVAGLVLWLPLLALARTLAETRSPWWARI